MKKINGLDWFIGAILIVGGINWGVIGLFEINLVGTLFGEMTALTRIVYSLVGFSALYITASALLTDINTVHRVRQPL